MELLSTDAVNINQEDIINNVVFSLSSSCLQILLWTAHKYLEHIVGNMPLILLASSGSKLWRWSGPDSVCQQQKTPIDHIASAFGSLSAHDYLASLALSQMSQNNLQGMYLSSRAKYSSVSLIEGKLFGIMNCLELKFLFLGMYEQKTVALMWQALYPQICPHLQCIVGRVCRIPDIFEAKPSVILRVILCMNSFLSWHFHSVTEHLYWNVLVIFHLCLGLHSSFHLSSE